MAVSDRDLQPNEQKTGPTSDIHAPMYQFSFWDKEVLEDRRKLVSIVVLPLLYTTVLMWICLSMFWGSLFDTNNLTRIDVTAVNLDTEFVGAAIVAAIKSATSDRKNQLNWKFDAGQVSDEASRQSVLDEKTWAVLQVSVNATSALTEALMSGDSYSPLGAVTLYVASARNQITTNSHVVPAVQSLLSPILSQIGVNNTASFLHSISGNKSAVDVALRCPQCLASPFVLHIVDLIPFDNAAAAGATMTGLIFLLTFTFTIFQILRNAGILMGERLKLSSAVAFRTVSSLLAYLVMALWYSLINLAYGVPLHRVYGAAGFVIFWMLNTCTMAAVGLPMESLFTLIGMKWAGYFLSFWIIVNVSGSFSSFNVVPSFYQYGYAFPFYHAIQGARTLIFGTKNHLGLNFGVLVAWMAVSVAGIYSIMFWRIKKNRSSGGHYVP